MLLQQISLSERYSKAKLISNGLFLLKNKTKKKSPRTLGVGFSVSLCENYILAPHVWREEKEVPTPMCGWTEHPQTPGRQMGAAGSVLMTGQAVSNLPGAVSHQQSAPLC